jgi:hypothetical protein
VNGWNISEMVFVMQVWQDIYISCNLFVHWWSEAFTVGMVSLNIVYAWNITLSLRTWRRHCIICSLHQYLSRIFGQKIIPHNFCQF